MEQLLLTSSAPAFRSLLGGVDHGLIFVRTDAFVFTKTLVHTKFGGIACKSRGYKGLRAPAALEKPRGGQRGAPERAEGQPRAGAGGGGAVGSKRRAPTGASTKRDISRSTEGRARSFLTNERSRTAPPRKRRGSPPAWGSIWPPGRSAGESTGRRRSRLARRLEPRRGPHGDAISHRAGSSPYCKSSGAHEPPPSRSSPPNARTRQGEAARRHHPTCCRCWPSTCLQAGWRELVSLRRMGERLE